MVQRLELEIVERPQRNRNDERIEELRITTEVLRNIRDKKTYRPTDSVVRTDTYNGIPLFYEPEVRPVRLANYQQPARERLPEPHKVPITEAHLREHYNKANNPVRGDYGIHKKG